MSLQIDVAKVSQVLLPDGKWREIVRGSFNTDSYEFIQDSTTIFGGGQAKETIPSTGATWQERDSTGRARTMFCPLTSIQAVSYGWAKKSERDERTT